MQYIYIYMYVLYINVYNMYVCMYVCIYIYMQTPAPFGCSLVLFRGCAFFLDTLLLLSGIYK